MTDLLLRVAALTGVYLLALTSVAPGDILVGLLLAAGVVAALRRIRPIAEVPLRPTRAALLSRLGGVPALVAGTLVDIARGTWQTARCCLAGRLPAPGVVAVPLTDDPAAPRLPGSAVSPVSAAAWAVRVGLGPDSLVVEVDERAGRMLLHVLDARDPDAVRSAQWDSYQRRQRRLFP